MALDGSTIIDLLKKPVSQETKFALPDDPKKDIGNKRWTNYKAPSFCATVKPATVADIQNVIKCATENEIPFLATATGHHFTNYEKVQGVLEIDISSLRSVSVDKNANSITVGGAVRFSEVMDPLYEAGKEMAVGACSSAGVVGVTLGGGLNRWQGIYGMLIDNLLAVEVVTGTGDLIKASATENQELFWGIRGAGFNFGIVVSATYRTYDLRNGGESLIADFILPYSAHNDIMQILKRWEEDQPPSLSIAAVLGFNEQAGGACFVVSALYLDGIEEGKKLVQPFIDLKPVMQEVRPVPYNQINKVWGFGADAGLGTFEEPRIIYTGHIKHIDIPTFEWHFDELVKLWEKHPAARQSAIIIEDWATKAKDEVPDDETAYPHRDVMCQMIWYGVSTDPALQPMIDEWLQKVRSRYDATSGYDERKVYVGYARGDEDQEVLYGKRKLNRLRALKKKYDPKGVFNFNVPIIV